MSDDDRKALAYKIQNILSTELSIDDEFDIVGTGPASFLIADLINRSAPTPLSRKKPDWRDPFCKRRDENVLSNIRDAYFYGFEDALEIVGNTPTPAPRANP